MKHRLCGLYKLNQNFNQHKDIRPLVNAVCVIRMLLEALSLTWLPGGCGSSSITMKQLRKQIMHSIC